MQATTQFCYFLPFQVCFEPATTAMSPLFGFAEFLSIMALLFVVLTLSDFRYRFRLLVTRYDLKKVAIYTSFGIGAAILIIDLWFYNSWWIPVRLNDQNNLKFFLAIIFLALVCYLLYVALINPPRFDEGNAKHYFSALYHFIGAGNPEELAVVANELRYSSDNIVRLASEIGGTDLNEKKSKTQSANAFAHDALLLLGNPKLCEMMVAKAPWTVAEFFKSFERHGTHNLPVQQFSSNVGGELVGNPDSALHREGDGFNTGYFGYAKPVSNSVYGNYRLVENLASKHGSPLDLPFDSKWGFKAPNLKTYARASLIFCKSYFPQAHRVGHSYSFTRMLRVFESATNSIYRLNGVESDFGQLDETRQLRVTVNFIRDLIELLDELKVKPKGKMKPTKKAYPGIHNQIANLIFEVIFDASSVSKPDWTCWSIQHNDVWSELFDFHDTENWKVIRFKVRRLLYDEIKRMDEFPNFKGARILGLCLNVLGLTAKRTRDYRKTADPLRIVAVNWAKNNYLALVEYSPKVAKTCLHGRMEFDPKSKTIIKYYGSDIEKEPKKSVLKLSNLKKATLKKWRD